MATSTHGYALTDTDNRIIGAKSPNTTVNIQTDTYNVLATDDVIICNKGTAMTINLPAATGSGRRLTINNIGVGTATVDGNAAETINGETTQPVLTNQSMQIVDYVSAKWIIV